LADLFAAAIRKNFDLHAGDQSPLQAGDKAPRLALDAALTRSTAEIKVRMRLLLEHEASHHGPAFVSMSQDPPALTREWNRVHVWQ